MKRSWLEILIGAAVLFGTAASAAAQVPGTVPFTARVENNGTPINGAVSLSFAVFDNSSGGTAVWSESYPSATANQGLVFVDLGGQNPLDASVFNSGIKYLEVTVNGTTMSPRLPIGSVPYAIHAGTADDVGGLMPGSIQQRVTGTCPSGAVSQINSDGSVGCVPVGKTYTGATPISVSGTTVSLSSCPAGQILKYNGGWACAADANNTYVAGTGLTLSGSTFNVDTTAIQSRVSGTCPAGSSIRVVNANGTVTCQPDNNTTYTTSSPITLNGTTIGLATGGVTSAYLAANSVGNTQLASNAATMSKISVPAGANPTTSGTLSVAGWNYIHASTGAFTPDASGTCLVSVALWAYSSASQTGGIYLNVDRHNNTSPSDNTYGTPVYLSNGQNSQWYAGETYAVPVTGGTSYTFGCAAWAISGSTFIGTSFYCNASWICI